MSGTDLTTLIAKAVEQTMYDRGDRVDDWPADEAALNRDYENGGWSDFEERRRMVFELRCRKAAAHVAAVLSGVYAITPLPEPDAPVFRWFVLRNGSFKQGGSPIAGPFSTIEDGLSARRVLEHSESHGDYWVDKWDVTTEAPQ